MTEDKNLLKARALLDRAGHPNTPEEEARSSAVIAARMIYENAFLLTVREEQDKPSVPAQPAEEPRAARTAAATAEHVKRIWDVFEKNSSRFRRVQAGLDFQVAPARFDGYCKACRRPFAEGETIAWMPGSGVTHFDCRAFWKKTSP